MIRYPQIGNSVFYWRHVVPNQRRVLFALMLGGLGFALWKPWFVPLYRTVGPALALLAAFVAAFVVAAVATMVLILRPAHGRTQTTRGGIAWVFWIAFVVTISALSTHQVSHGHHVKFESSFVSSSEVLALFFGGLWLLRRILLAFGSWFSGVSLRGSAAAYGSGTTFITDSSGNRVATDSGGSAWSSSPSSYDGGSSRGSSDGIGSQNYYDDLHRSQDAQQAANRAYDARVRADQAADALRRSEQDARNTQNRNR